MIEVCRYPLDQVAYQTAQNIASVLGKMLKTGPTLCLLSGGSVGKDVVPELVKLLHDFPLSNLHMGLIDERYGVVGHGNSNAALLEKAGLTHLTHHGAHFYPILHSRYNSVTETVTAYALQLQNLISGCQQRTVGVFGIGSDGHTAGIKPMAKDEFKALYIPDALIVGYKAADFTRITITPDCITELKQIFIYAAGNEKQSVIQKLVSSDKKIPAFNFPAVLLHSTKSQLCASKNG